MPRIQPLDPKSATGRSKELLDAVAKKFGKAPNLLKTLAHSPAALQTYLAAGEALEGASLSPVMRERIALHVAERNECDYCLAAHSAKGKMVGLKNDDLIESRRGESDDAKTAAILRLAGAIVESKGFVNDDLLAQARQAGVTAGEIAEIVAVVVMNIFTNYANHVFDTEVDFPKVEALPAAV